MVLQKEFDFMNLRGFVIVTIIIWWLYFNYCCDHNDCIKDNETCQYFLQNDTLK